MNISNEIPMSLMKVDALRVCVCVGLLRRSSALGGWMLVGRPSRGAAGVCVRSCTGLKAIRVLVGIACSSELTQTPSHPCLFDICRM